MWNDTLFSRRVGLKYPIVQGSFGGGPSSVELLAAVSNAGGLGSFGMHLLEPAEIRNTITVAKAATNKPFAVNLWLAQDPEPSVAQREQLQAGRDLLQPYLNALGLEQPDAPGRFLPNLNEQLEAVLEARPPVFSFIYGIPDSDVLERCRARGIITFGTATTADEAVALEAAGVDCVVASGPEAGGHRGSFLKPPEDSLVGMIALVPQVADVIRIPFVAAGGIVDSRGITAALALGAHGVQIGSAFLACDQSNANALHRSLLFSRRSAETVLTRAFTGRLARSMRNGLADNLRSHGANIPAYPIQSWLVGHVKSEALAQDRDDLISLSAGQGSPLIRHRCAIRLMESLVRDVPLQIERLKAA